MKPYLLDTNILLFYFRQDLQWAYINTQYNLQTLSDNVVSIVSWGELYALALRNAWGQRRVDILDRLSSFFIMADIYEETILRKYGEIDAYSQGKLFTNPLPTGTASRNMGKNDLWIAATAHVLDIPLLTSDSDFDHLNGVYLTVEKVIYSTI
jgi:predicted nucleic acid-binding protein